MMSPGETRRIGDLDKQLLWHPFTPMEPWCAPGHQPLVLARGEGIYLWDSEGNRYIDGNSSIWTNIHGHNHPRINAAIRAQLEQAAHTSFLGFTHPAAVELAERLIYYFPSGAYSRVFFSDNGSTAIEVAIKMAIQWWQIAGKPERRKFVAFANAYHGDTLGAASLGGIRLFHERFADSHFATIHVSSMEELEQLPKETIETIAGAAIEPLVQGAAQMRLWPRGMLAKLRKWCDEHQVFLIADEIMTGFGRTGTLFACEQEGIWPDFLALAKGITGGYLPLAATLVNERVAKPFLSGPPEQTTFFYGHSYTANALGCAAALASWQIFHDEKVIEKLQPKIAAFAGLLKDRLGSLAQVGEIRRIGLLAGIDLQGLTGADVCLAAREHGLLTRPIRDTIVLMPPLCIQTEQLADMVEAVRQAIVGVSATAPERI